MDKIQSFEQLRVWQEAQNLAVLVYGVSRRFPDDEKFAMTSQIRRAVSSVSANIAEGFGRRTVNDKTHFYSMAYGSLLETKNFTYLAKKLGYIEGEQETDIIDKISDCQKLLNAFMKAHKT